MFNKNNVKYIVYIVPILLVFISCFPLRKNNQYAKDYIELSKNDYAKKYLSLYPNQIIDFSKVKENKGYVVFRNNDTFQIILFCSDGFTYTSSLMPLIMLNSKIPKQKLFRDCLFSIDNKIVKFETMNVNINSAIEEGIVENDTIFMKKKYYSAKPNNIRHLNYKYILYEKIKVYKFSDDYFIIESD